MSLPLLLAAGFLLNGAAGALAWRRGSVDAGGAVVGAIMAALIFGFGGPLFWVVLAAFFVTSTAAGKLRHREKEYLRRIHQKGERRDLVQVLANGGLGALTAVIYHITGDPAWAAAFAVSFAASNADTWAGEIGVLSHGAPVSLLTFRPVPRGISGGVTPLGTAASLAGALLIGLLFGVENLILHVVPGSLIRVTLFVTAFGFAGSLVDSMLGATLQARYASADNAGGITERRRSRSGLPNPLAGGLSFVNNDVVNVLSGMIVTTLAVLVAPFLS